MLNKIGLGDLQKEKGNAFAFFLILFLSFFLFADQNLIAPNLKNIANSLKIQNSSEIDIFLGGFIPASFFILGGIVSLTTGVLSQKFSRKYLLIISVLLGEIPCFLTGFADSYIEFFIYRTLCGFGLGGVFPVIFSMLGDYFTDKSRAIASGYISLSMGLGVGIGQLIGAILGENDPVNGWRYSFFILAIPSFIFLGLYGLICKEPIRGNQESYFNLSEKQDKSISFREFKKVIFKPVNLSVILQGIPGCIPWGVFFVFLADFYETTYGIGKIAASSLLTFAALGIMVGMLLGGVIGQWLYNKKKEYQPIFGMSSILIGVIPCYFLIHSGQEFVGTTWFIVLNFITGIIISFPAANIRSILINVNDPKSRGPAFALYNLTDDLGKGLGPAIAAYMLWLIPDRTLALSISIFFWIPCAIFWIPIILKIRSEEELVKDSFYNLRG